MIDRRYLAEETHAEVSGEVEAILKDIERNTPIISLSNA